MNVPICVNSVTGNDANDGRGWANALATIQAAVIAAEPGDEIWVAGNQSNTVAMTIDKNLGIYGGFTGIEDRKTVRSGKSEIMARMTINSVNNVTLDGLSVKNCTSGALYVTGGSSVVIINCEYSGNSVGGAGGAINLDSSSTLKIYDSVFTGNSVSVSALGGAIYANNSSVTIDQTLFGGTAGNSALYGGAIYITNSILTVSRSRFGEKTGGGNSANSGGGAIYATGVSTVNIQDNCEFYKNNTSNGSGGAVCAYSSTVLTIENSFFGSDVSESGNTTDVSSGGAIYANNNNCIIRNTVFKNNSTSQSGGAIYFVLTGPSKAKVLNCLFSGNKATSSNGGAVRIDSGSVEISNTLFSGNSTTSGSGGAMYFASTSADNYFVNLTFYNNVAVSGGAIYFNPTSSVSINMYNSAFYGNTGGTSYNILKNANAVLSMNHSFYNGGISTLPNTEVECITANPDSPFISIDPASTSFLIPGTDLGDLGLFNKGLNTIPGFTIPSTDLGGNPRKVGTIDIGCYEKQ